MEKERDINSASAVRRSDEYCLVVGRFRRTSEALQVLGPPGNIKGKIVIAQSSISWSLSGLWKPQ